MYLVGHTEQLFKVAYFKIFKNYLIYTMHNLLVDFLHFKYIFLLKVTFLLFRLDVYTDGWKLIDMD